MRGVLRFCTSGNAIRTIPTPNPASISVSLWIVDRDMREFYASVIIWGAACVAFLIAAIVGCAREPFEQCADVVCLKDSECSFLVEPNYIQLRIHHQEHLDHLSSYVNNDVAVNAIKSLSRGMCSPGERMTRDVDTGDIRCRVLLSYPNALNDEAMRHVGVDEAPDHERACGMWIREETYEPQVWRGLYMSTASMDSPERLRREEMDAHSVRSYGHDVHKYYEMCQTMFIGGAAAMHTTAVSAYHFLASSLEQPRTRSEVLAALGGLTGHYCDTPVRISGYHSYPETIMMFERGVAFHSGVVTEALRAMGESAQAQQNAELVVAFRSSQDRVGMDDLRTLTKSALLMNDTVRTVHSNYAKYNIYEPFVKTANPHSTNPYFEPRHPNARA